MQPICVFHQLAAPPLIWWQAESVPAEIDSSMVSWIDDVRQCLQATAFTY